MHGLVIEKAKDGQLTYKVYNKGSEIETLDDSAVKAVNDGTRKIAQMEVFNNEEYTFLHGQSLTFDWIEKEGRIIEVLADDLVELAVKKGLDKHEVPEAIDNELKELLKQYPVMVA